MLLLMNALFISANAGQRPIWHSGYQGHVLNMRKVKSVFKFVFSGATSYILVISNSEFNFKQEILFVSDYIVFTLYGMNNAYYKPSNIFA